MKFKITSLILLVFTAIIYNVYGNESEINLSISFLESYGWEVLSEPTERIEIIIPEVFDKVYKNYNEIQKNAGLDLLPFCGKNAVRYSFVVTNYPQDVGETVYANVICIGGKPVAGDIMTVSLSGFMHALNKTSP